MSILEKLNPKKLFKATVPELQEYLGRKVLIPAESEPVVIKSIVGNYTNRTFLEINGEHLIGALRFFAQMNGVKDITEQQFRDFENMEMEVEKLPERRTALEVPRGL